MEVYGHDKNWRKQGIAAGLAIVLGIAAVGCGDSGQNEEPTPTITKAEEPT